MFIVFEGPDGSGKSTQIELLRQELQTVGHRVTVTREPGGCPVAEAVRGILLDIENAGMAAEAEALLYAAARAEHVERVIVPALERGDIVLCDRYLMSSLAYQGYGRGLGVEWIWQINRAARERAMPDLTFLFQLSAGEALGRKEAQKALDRIEAENMEFHQRVTAGFARLADSFPGTVPVDARLSVDELHEQIRKNISQLQNA